MLFPHFQNSWIYHFRFVRKGCWDEILNYLKSVDRNSHFATYNYTEKSWFCELILWCLFSKDFVFCVSFLWFVISTRVIGGVLIINFSTYWNFDLQVNFLQWQHTLRKHWTNYHNEKLLDHLKLIVMPTMMLWNKFVSLTKILLSLNPIFQRGFIIYSVGSVR